MRTIKVNVYKFNELSEAVKESIVDGYKREQIFSDYIWQDGINTAKSFTDIFGVRSNRSCFKANTGQIGDDILDLTGVRLLKYLVNNYWEYLYTGKYYFLWSNLEYAENPMGAKLKTRRSKVLFSSDCPITGICYDMVVLQPIYEFISKPDDRNLADLIQEGLDNLKHALEEEEESRYTLDYISDHCEENGYEFYSDGRIYCGQ